MFNAKVTYLSFPITAPRELEANGDTTFRDFINRAHQLAANEMMTRRTRCFISPLAIDELPIVFKAKNATEGSTEVDFDCENDRWNLARLWGDPQLVILPSLTGVRNFPMAAQVENAAGAIRTDVGWRDRRLVLQSDSLAIVCPKPPGEDRITRGVNEEIQTAVPLGIVCNLWQNPAWDPDDFVGKTFPPAGSMGLGHTQASVRKVGSLEELIRTNP